MKQLTVDLHTHLLEKEVLPEAYWKAVKGKGLDAIAITEHSFLKPEKAYSMLLEKKPRNVTLLPGMELSTSIGHVVALSEGPEIYEIPEFREKKVAIGKAMTIAEKQGFLLSIAHPWGLSYDSAAYILGEKKLYRFVEEKEIGVEAFNGMFGNVSSFFYATNWVRKPMNFFDFLEKSRFGKKTRLSRLGKKGKEKLDKKGKEILERCMKPYQLAEKASYATAGSDAHKPTRLGTGITKLEAKSAKPGHVLKALKSKKSVKWLGPYVKESSQGYQVEKTSVEKTEVLSGLKYAAKRALAKKVKRKKS
jgi:hypothetical protein